MLLRFYDVLFLFVLWTKINKLVFIAINMFINGKFQEYSVQ